MQGSFVKPLLTCDKREKTLQRLRGAVAQAKDERSFYFLATSTEDLPSFSRSFAEQRQIKTSKSSTLSGCRHGEWVFQRSLTWHSNDVAAPLQTVNDIINYENKDHVRNRSCLRHLRCRFCRQIMRAVAQILRTTQSGGSSSESLPSDVL